MTVSSTRFTRQFGIENAIVCGGMTAGGTAVPSLVADGERRALGLLAAPPRRPRRRWCARKLDAVIAQSKAGTYEGDGAELRRTLVTRASVNQIPIAINDVRAERVTRILPAWPTWKSRGLPRPR